MSHRQVSPLCGRFALWFSVSCFRQPTGMTAWPSKWESHAHLKHAHQPSMSLDTTNQSKQMFDFWGVCKSSPPCTWRALQSLWHKRLSGLLQPAANTGSKCHPFIGLSCSDVLQVWALQVFDYRICTSCVLALKRIIAKILWLWAVCLINSWNVWQHSHLLRKIHQKMPKSILTKQHCLRLEDTHDKSPDQEQEEKQVGGFGSMASVFQAKKAFESLAWITS